MGIWKEDSLGSAAKPNIKMFSFYLDEESFTNDKRQIHLFVSPIRRYNKFSCSAFDCDRLDANDEFEHKFEANSEKEAKIIAEKILYEAYDKRINKLKEKLSYHTKQQKKINI